VAERFVPSALLLALATWPAAAAAQGHSSDAHGRPSPPSSSELTSGAPGVGALPLAWLDDADLVAAGAMSISLSASHWSGDGVSETDAPAVNAAIGLTDRVQLTAALPYVMADPSAGVVGGFGTAYFSAKFSAYDNRRAGVKVAVAPTLELLGSGVLASLGARDTRAQVGIPVSAEIDRSGRRVYAASGWFSRGVWFAGGGASAQIAGRAALSISFSRSWTTPDEASGVTRSRAEASGGIAYALTRSISAFASVSTTIATLPDNGAGTTLSGGVSFYVSPRRIARSSAR
jgi:hypothetical protein